MTRVVVPPHAGVLSGDRIVSEALMPGHEDAEVGLYLVGLRLREPLFPEDYLTTEAELHRCLDCARSQGGKMIELRAATSLARLWKSRGRTKEASALLAPIYSWFTEGFDTPDLLEAKALLATMA